MINSKKILGGLTTGSLLLGFLAPSALAATDIRISGNGSNSRSDVSVNNEYDMSVMQNNRASFNNHVRVNSSTGGNKTNDNTGGDLNLRTGDASTLVEIANSANMNSLSIGNGNCCENSNGNGGNGNGGNGNGSSSQHMRLSTMLDGDTEVPGPGDGDGTGRARLSFNMEANELCVKMRVRNIQQATAAHIHEAPMGIKGPVVVTLPTPDSSGRVNSCMTISDNLAQDLAQDPENYYINVHNTQYPDGAIRGQL